MATILLVEDDTDLRETLIELVESYGERCLATGSYAGLVALGTQVREADLALVDVNLGPGVPSGLEAWAYLQALGFEGEVVFLTGHAANHPLVREAKAMEHVRVLTKPLALVELERLLVSPLPRAAPVPEGAHAP